MSETTTETNNRERALTESIGHFTSALELDPSAVEVRAELAGVHRSRATGRRVRGDLEGALDDLRCARELAPRDEAITSDLADVCAALAQALKPSAVEGRLAAEESSRARSREASPVKSYPHLATIAQGQVLRLEGVIPLHHSLTLATNHPVAVSGDGTVVAAAFGKSVRVRDARTARKMASFPSTGHRSIAFGGAMLAVGTFDMSARTASVRVWDVGTHVELPGLKTRDQHTLVALSPSGDLLATGGHEADGVVDLWDLRTGERRWTVKQTAPSAMSFSSDGRRFLLGGDHGVDVLDVESGQITSAVRDLPWRCDRASLLDGDRVLFLERHEKKSRHSVLHVVDLTTGQDVRRITTGDVAASGPLVIGNRCFFTTDVRDWSVDDKSRVTGGKNVVGSKILGFDLDTGERCETIDLGHAELVVASDGLNTSGPVLVVATKSRSIVGHDQLLIYRPAEE